MQRCGRLLSELFVQLIFVCKPGGGNNCSHVARYEDIASGVCGSASLRFGRSLAHSKGEREKGGGGGEGREVLLSGVSVLLEVERENAASNARFSLSTSRSDIHSLSTRRDDIALVLNGLTAAVMHQRERIILWSRIF